VNDTRERYVWKEIPGSSHDVLRRRIRAMPSGLRLLDLGAAGGHLGRAVRDRCSFIAGVEPHPPESTSAKDGYDDWREQDALHAGQWDESFDAVVCADVLEHFTQPEKLLERVRAWLKNGGVLFASIPNVANISVRLALLFGQFRYADRGILDRTHVAFYTRASAKDLLEGSGFRIRAVEATAMPYELAVPSLSSGPWSAPTRTVAQASARAWPTLFGYQFVFEATKEEL
jgi:2-polyprenyl-3-methyl-5-hydroxy-6-metoxy-1,4-benzoquinol methylase